MELAPAVVPVAQETRAAWELGAALVQTVEGLGTAALLLDPNGSPLHLGRALSALLEPDREAGRVIKAAGTLARRLARNPRGPMSGPGPCAATHVRTAGSDYVLRGVSHPMKWSWAGTVVLVSVAREDEILPSRATLVARHAFTPREAEIALLLARGASDQEAAERLCISHHTVRKHAEHIFAKLGIHSRKALALRLMES